MECADQTSAPRQGNPCPVAPCSQPATTVGMPGSSTIVPLPLVLGSQSSEPFGWRCGWRLPRTGLGLIFLPVCEPSPEGEL
jgi:hypothetical protein